MPKSSDRIGVSFVVPVHNGGQWIAETLASIEPSTQRIDLLRRNRAALGRTAASTLIGAIGRALPPSDADQIRIGAIRDAQTQ